MYLGLMKAFLQMFAVSSTFFSLTWHDWHDESSSSFGSMVFYRRRSPRAHLHVVGTLRFMFLTLNLPSLPTPFCSVLVSVSVLWSFQLYFIPWILPTTRRFLTLFFRSYFCLTGPFNYISLYESLLQPWCNPSWLTGLKVPTNYLAIAVAYTGLAVMILEVS